MTSLPTTQKRDSLGRSATTTGIQKRDSLQKRDSIRDTELGDKLKKFHTQIKITEETRHSMDSLGVQDMQITMTEGVDYRKTETDDVRTKKDQNRLDVNRNDHRRQSKQGSILGADLAKLQTSIDMDKMNSSMRFKLDRS